VDTVITELGVFRVDRARGAFVVIELADDVSFDDVRAKTEATLLPAA
jgi:acyl CoA:acetate/3-ketoacid CoA transferase beta subunit